MPFQNVNGKTLHYSDSGGDGVAIVLIHGLGSSQNYYAPVTPALTGFRCVALDTHGSGRSKYHGQLQSVESIASDIVRFCEALNIVTPVLVGHSMGGLVVSYLASEYPDKFRAAIAIGPVHPSTAIAQVFDSRIALVEKEGMEPLADSIPKAATGASSNALHHAFIRELLLSQDPKGYISLCKVISTAQPPSYSSVIIPLLVIAGEDDKSAPLEGCKYIFEHVSSAKKELVILKGVGHWHCIEANERVGEEITKFLNKI